MPTMYRIGCLRDGKKLIRKILAIEKTSCTRACDFVCLDVVFFVFLYQRWIYKTDPTRVNEFGYSAEMEKKKLAEKTTPQQAIAESSTADTTAKTEEAKKED